MIYLTGDTHGNFSRFTTANFPAGPSLTKKDIVVILGDFGLFWSTRDQSNSSYWAWWLGEKPWTTLFIDGNHENFDLINDLPEVDMFGGKVGVAGDSIYHLKRGQLYNIDGNSIFTLGGAGSIDKDMRTEGLSWWAEENISKEDIENSEQVLNSVDWKVDYIFTHTIPNSVMPEFGIFNNIDSNSYLLEDIRLQMQGFKHWYCGHMHRELTISNPVTGPYLTSLYEKIIPLGTYFGES